MISLTLRLLCTTDFSVVNQVFAQERRKLLTNMQLEVHQIASRCYGAQNG